MKKFFLSALALALCFCLFACGAQSANAQMTTKINKTISHMSNTIKEVESVNENDILINNILPSESTYTAIINPRRGVNTTKQIVNYNQNMPFGYSQTEAMKNVNTYNTYGKNHNVNSFAGYGETNGVAYNEINQAQYGNGMNPAYPNAYPNPAYPNGMGGYGMNGYQNGYGMGGYGMGYGYNRGISNVNTYGLGTSNVNTYAPNVEQNNTQTTNNQTTLENNQNNVNTYQNANQQNGYEEYQNNANKQNQFTKLSALYSVAGNVVSINRAIADERNYILTMTNTITELANELKNKEVDLTESEKNGILSLLDNIQSNITKINLSKNEVKYEVEKVKSMKNNYQNLTEQLSSRYIRLTNCLETRYSYYCNISSCLDQLKNMLTFGQTQVEQQPNNNQTNVAKNNTNTQNHLNNQNNITSANETTNTNQNQQATTKQQNQTVLPQQNTTNHQTTNENNTIQNNTNQNNTNQNNTTERSLPTNPSLQDRLTQAFERAQKQQEAEQNANTQTEQKTPEQNEQNQPLQQNNQNIQPATTNNQPSTMQTPATQNNSQNTENNWAGKLEQELSNQAKQTKPVTDKQPDDQNTQPNNASQPNNSTENATTQPNNSTENPTTQPKKPYHFNLYQNKNNQNNQENNQDKPIIVAENAKQTSGFPFKEPKKYDFLNANCPPKQNVEPLTQEEQNALRPTMARSQGW